MCINLFLIYLQKANDSRRVRDIYQSTNFSHVEWLQRVCSWWVIICSNSYRPASNRCHCYCTIHDRSKNEISNAWNMNNWLSQHRFRCFEWDETEGFGFPKAYFKNLDKAPQNHGNKLGIVFHLLHVIRATFVTLLIISSVIEQNASMSGTKNW